MPSSPTPQGGGFWAALKRPHVLANDRLAEKTELLCIEGEGRPVVPDVAFLLKIWLADCLLASYVFNLPAWHLTSATPQLHHSCKEVGDCIIPFPSLKFQNPWSARSVSLQHQGELASSASGVHLDGISTWTSSTRPHTETSGQLGVKADVAASNVFVEIRRQGISGGDRFLVACYLAVVRTFLSLLRRLSFSPTTSWPT